MKKILLIFSIILVIMIFGFAFANQNETYKTPGNITFDISLSKTTYLSSEPIWMELRTAASTKDEIDIKPELLVGGDVRITLINSKSKSVPYYGAISDYFPQRNSSASFENWYDLLDGFGNIEVWFSLALPPDSYTVYAEITSKSKGEFFNLTSNKLTFNIIEPAGSEKDAHDLWYDIKKTQEETKNVFAVKKMVDSFMITYPNSVYRDKVYSTLISSLPRYIDNLNDNEKKEFIQNAVLSYPDSYHNIYYLRYLYYEPSYKNNSESYISFVEAIMGLSTSNLLDQFCDKMVETAHYNEINKKQK